MLSHLAARARAEANHVAQTAAIGAFASIAIAVGAAFWTLAGWLFLLTVTSALNAAVIVAAIYTGAGLIGFAVMSSRRRKFAKPVVAAPPPAASLDNLVAAFMTGLNAGSRSRS